MSTQKAIEAAKSALAAIELNDDAKGYVDATLKLLSDLAKGKTEKVERELTKWADVNETYELAGKGAELRETYAKRASVTTVIFKLVALAAQFAPALKVVKKGKASKKK